MLAFLAAAPSISLRAQLTWNWAESIDVNCPGGCSGITVEDDTGNLYVTGTTFAGLTLDSIYINQTASFNLFIAKYDNDGNVQWAHSSKEHGGCGSGGIAVSSDGTVYVYGNYNPPTKFESVSLPDDHYYGTCIVKYNTSGDFIWTQGLSQGDFHLGTLVGLDKDNNIFAKGFYVDSQLFIGPDTLMPLGGQDIFLVKYNSALNVVWTKSISGEENDYPGPMTIDEWGNSYLWLYTSSPSIDLGEIVLEGSENYLLKFDQVGNVIWAMPMQGIDCRELASDSGFLYLTGGFGYDVDTIVIGSTILVTHGGDDMLLIKFDTSGTIVWAKNFGGIGDDLAYCIEKELSGNIFLAGTFSDTLSVGSSLLTSDANNDLFVAKFDASGNGLWAEKAISSGYGIPTSLAITSHGIGISGSYGGPQMDFGSIEITNNTYYYDAFVAEMDSTEVFINEPSTEFTFTVFPNPAADVISLDYANPIHFIEIFNIVNQQVLIMESASQIDISSLDAGMYILKLNTDRGYVLSRFIKL